MLRSLTGVQPSGQIHLGNYLGALKPALARQSAGYQCLYFIPDLHALTSTKNASLIHEQTFELVATWIALGFDHNTHLLYRQSDIPGVTEFAWYLSCCTGFGLLEKCHAYKDAVANAKDINHGVFAYPVLMAADILMYEADVVPVGKDQKQHVEIARDIAGSVNALYGPETLKVPELSIDERVMTIPGLDGRKMSKSYNNTIPLFADRETLKKKVLSIKTDSSALESPKSMRGNLLGELYSLFGSTEEEIDLEARLNAGGLGWGNAKLELFEVIDREVSQSRGEYEKLRHDKLKLEQILVDGAKRAREISAPILERLRVAVGMGRML